MKLFISWSGERSRVAANALRDFLPRVLPGVEPWLSEVDIEVGERWEDAIAEQLRTSEMGILCLTRSNIASSWMMFEAGALAITRSIRASSVIPLLVDLQHSDVPGPLLQFKVATTDRQGIRRMLATINRGTAVPALDIHVEAAFEKAWPKMKKALEAVTAPSNGTPLWAKAMEIVNDASASGDYATAVDSLVALTLQATNSVNPVLRLWGNRGGLAEEQRKIFERVGAAIGRAAAERNVALSGSMVHPNTLEYSALKGLTKAVTAEKTRPVFYLHFNGSEAPYVPGEAAELYSTAASLVKVVEVTYPQHSSDQQDLLNSAVSGDKTPAHDARFGSLFQCDSVLTLGGNMSERHLVQLLIYISRSRIRAAKPIFFVPLPWAGGATRRIFDSFRGVLDELDPSRI